MDITAELTQEMPSWGSQNKNPSKDRSIQWWAKKFGGGKVILVQPQDMAAHMQDQKIVALSNFQNSTVRIRCGLAVSLQGARYLLHMGLPSSATIFGIHSLRESWFGWSTTYFLKRSNLLWCVPGKLGKILGYCHDKFKQLRCNYVRHIALNNMPQP
jgi:hypothetical protein